MENIESKLGELRLKKQQMEGQINMITQQLNNMNREYLTTLGELKAYLEMKKSSEEVIEEIEEEIEEKP